MYDHERYSVSTENGSPAYRSYRAVTGRFVGHVIGRGRKRGRQGEIGGGRGYIQTDKTEIEPENGYRKGQRDMLTP